MTRLTKDRGSLAKDDRIDALALGVHYWTKAMAQGTKKAAEAARAEALEAELQKFIQHVIGGEPARPPAFKRATLGKADFRRRPIADT